MLLLPHVAQYSSPRLSTRSSSSFSGSPPSTLSARSSGSDPSRRVPYTSSPSAAPRSAASRQCASRSLPPSLSDQGREPATFGAQSRQLLTALARCTSSAHSATTTIPSLGRTPPRLQKRFCRLTPRNSNALLRATSRPALPLRLGRRTAARLRGRAPSTSAHSVATSVSCSRSAFLCSC